MRKLKRANKGRGFHLISLVNVDEENLEAFKEEAEIMVADILRGKSYSCSALNPRKNKGVARDGKFEYDFGISKACQIFNHLIKGQQIRLKDGHKIPSPNKLKGKKYCNWDNSYSHFTINCIVFRQAVTTRKYGFSGGYFWHYPCFQPQANAFHVVVCSVGKAYVVSVLPVVLANP